MGLNLKKERDLFKIFPVKFKIDWNGYPEPYGYVSGFWGFIFNLFDVDYKGKIYHYYGNYFEGVYNQYKWRRGHIYVRIKENSRKYKKKYTKFFIAFNCNKKIVIAVK